MYLHLAADQSQDALIEELNKANVICIVYSVDDDLTIDRVICLDSFPNNILN